MISVKNIAKTFYIPQSKNLTLKEKLIHLNFKSKYHPLEILKDISFDISKGKCLGIIGKNGSGKSTLLKIISGIYVEDCGKVNISGNLIPFLELGVGFNDELSAKDNIFLNGIILGMSRKNIKQKFDEIVEFADIKPFLYTKLKNFSSGMKARLGFSIAIHVNADIYIFDEILSVGDISFQNKSTKIIHDFKNQGKTIILVSHNLRDIQNFCDEVILLEKGRIKFSGFPDDVVNFYTTNS